jgi:serine/threonine-protein kinase
MASAPEQQTVGATLPTGEACEQIKMQSGEHPVRRPTIPVPPLEQFALLPVPGTVLGGKYRINRVLGAGGNGVVAEACDLQLRRRVALKYLQGDTLGNTEVCERFAREARAAARLRGEHVVRVLDVGVFDDGSPYTVLEYLEGVDLDRYVTERGALPVALAVRYVLEACEALAEAHTAGIVHRDLKPANIFLAKGPDRRRIVKVLDFGVSKIVDDPITEPARLLGSVAYMSPEQLDGAHHVDLRTDIWSIGVTLYELLAGVLPFSGTVAQVAAAIRTNAHRRLTELRPDVPAGLEAVIARCMRSNPAKRYESVLDLALALAPFAEARDRESVRTISAVLCGSIAPPSLGGRRHSSGSFDEALTYLVTSTSQLSSDTPASMAVQPNPRSTTAPAPRPRSGTPWLAGVAVTIAFMIGFSVALARTGALPIAAPSRADITLRITADRPNGRVRIDDSPPAALPFEASVPRDDRTHILFFESDGRVISTRLVRFTGDLDVKMAGP